jgi:hypothetical protein
MRTGTGRLGYFRATASGGFNKVEKIVPPSTPVGSPSEFGIGTALNANGTTALIGGSADNDHHGAAWIATIC